MRRLGRLAVRGRSEGRIWVVMMLVWGGSARVSCESVFERGRAAEERIWLASRRGSNNATILVVV